MSDIIILATVGTLIKDGIYVHSLQKKLKEHHLKIFKRGLNEIDLKEVNRLIEVVKKEMKELPAKSSLTPVQKCEVMKYCQLLLFNYFENDFTLERRKLCIKIWKYCHIVKHERFFTDSIYYRKIMERLE